MKFGLYFAAMVTSRRTYLNICLLIGLILVMVSYIRSTNKIMLQEHYVSNIVEREREAYIAKFTIRLTHNVTTVSFIHSRDRENTIIYMYYIY